MSSRAFRWAIICTMFVQVLGGAIVMDRRANMQPQNLIDVAAGFPNDPRCLYGSLTQQTQNTLCYIVNQALASPGCTTHQCGCNSVVATAIENCYSCQLVVTKASPANITAAQTFMDTYVNQCNTAGFPVQQLHVNLNVTIRSDNAASRPMSPRQLVFGVGLLWLISALMP